MSLFLSFSAVKFNRRDAGKKRYAEFKFLSVSRTAILAVDLLAENLHKFSDIAAGVVLPNCNIHEDQTEIFSAVTCSVLLVIFRILPA